MNKKTQLEASIQVELLDEDSYLTMAELCRACAVESAQIVRLVDEGIIEPIDDTGHPLQFSPESLKRVRISVNLQRDLGVNLAGVALALELLERIDQLDRHLQRIAKP